MSLSHENNDANITSERKEKQEHLTWKKEMEESGIAGPGRRKRGK
jgi:hypothetical protein